MKLLLPTIVVALVVIVECNHMFTGTNIKRPLVHRHTAKYSSQMFQKRVETFFYSTPPSRGTGGPIIKGILAYDLTNSSASVNVTSGGVGYPFVGLRMKSDRGEPIKYDINIYI